MEYKRYNQKITIYCYTKEAIPLMQYLNRGDRDLTYDVTLNPFREEQGECECICHRFTCNYPCDDCSSHKSSPKQSNEDKCEEIEELGIEGWTQTTSLNRDYWITTKLNELIAQTNKNTSAISKLQEK